MILLGLKLLCARDRDALIRVTVGRWLNTLDGL